jgi:hypothetical protein
VARGEAITQLVLVSLYVRTRSKINESVSWCGEGDGRYSQLMQAASAPYALHLG